MIKLPVFYQIIEGLPVVNFFVVVDQPIPRPTSEDILHMLQDDDIVNSEPASLSAWRIKMGLDLSDR